MAGDRKPVFTVDIEGLEELEKAINRVADVLTKVIRHFVDKAVPVAVSLKKTLVGGWVSYVEKNATSKEWHYMKYSKKKRIRKKYYNRARKRALQKLRED